MPITNLDYTLTQGDEQASGDQVGAGARIQTGSEEPGVQVSEGSRTGRLSHGRHVAGPPAHFLGHVEPFLAGDQAVGMMGQDIEVREDDGLFDIATGVRPHVQTLAS